MGSAADEADLPARAVPHQGEDGDAGIGPGKRWERSSSPSPPPLRRRERTGNRPPREKEAGPMPYLHGPEHRGSAGRSRTGRSPRRPGSLERRRAGSTRRSARGFQSTVSGGSMVRSEEARANRPPIPRTSLPRVIGPGPGAPFFPPADRPPRTVFRTPADWAAPDAQERCARAVGGERGGKNSAPGPDPAPLQTGEPESAARIRPPSRGGADTGEGPGEAPADGPRTVGTGAGEPTGVPPRGTAWVSPGSAGGVRARRASVRFPRAGGGLPRRRARGPGCGTSRRRACGVRPR